MSASATGTDDPGNPLVELVHARLLNLLKDEVELGERLDTRATLIAGVAGTLLTFSVAARKLIHDLGRLDQPTQDIAFAIGALALLGAAIIAVWSITRQIRWHYPVQNIGTWIEELLKGRWMPDDLRDQEIPVVYQGFGSAVDANHDKTVRTGIALGLLLLGAVAIAIQALVGVI